MESVTRHWRWLGSEHLLPNPHSIVTRSYGLLTRVRSRCDRVALVAVALALAGAGCGGASTHTAAGPRAAVHTGSSTAAAAKAGLARPAQLVYHPLYSLAAPLRDPASAVLGSGRFV